MRIKAVLFDFDGTLTEPGFLDYSAIRDAIGCPKGSPILECIARMRSRARRAKALRILDELEWKASRLSRPNAGAEELLRMLLSRNLKIGIISRNSLRSIRRALKNFRRIRASDFSVIMTRDDPQLPKPSPEGILAAAGKMGVRAEQVLVVGDFVFDVEAGQNAGAHTAFLTNGSVSPAFRHPPDFTIQKLEELQDIVRLHSPLRNGKLPNDLLARFLGECVDPSLLIRPGVGEDVAAIQLDGEDVLVLKSDPVTFATEAIGYYAVVVNVNDLATSGATPRWLLTTLLFPAETSAAQAGQVMNELRQAARQHGLLLCGGHTEITDAVTRPVVVAQAAGTVPRRNLVDKLGMRGGDKILLTKGMAVEGTCIIAREFPQKLRRMGMSAREIEKCRQFLNDPGISILKEARIATRSGRVTAMHDVTEGGAATALEELSAAGGRRIRVFVDRIPVLKETRRICGLLNMNPLGLIGSGSLLICCERDYCEELLRSIREAGVAATCIGEVLEKGAGIEAVDLKKGKAAELPHFEVDEIARLFERSGDPSSPRRHGGHGVFTERHSQ